MSSFLAILIEINIAAAAAILFVMLLRRPMARVFGPQAAYGLWAVVPVAMIGILIPERVQETLAAEFLVGGLPASLAAIENAASNTWAPVALGMVWAVGMAALAALLVRRQRAFMRDADIGLAGPAIVGFRHPRIVTPDDFERRFSYHERKLILTHEQVHLDRSDARINAIVAVMRCVFWFNPLIHIGAKAMRIDQELSCDAEVVERRPRVRRAYAETLLKTHLSAQALPVGCHWPAEAQHPLAERIDLLARKPVSVRRKVAAAVLVVSLTGGAGVAAWAAQPERTVFRETADVIVPFQPIPRDGKLAEGDTRPLLVPQSVSLGEAWPLPHNASKAEVTAELCISSAGGVDSATLVKSSGYDNVDALALGAMQGMTFKPATRNGAPISVCNHGFTMVYDSKASPGASPP